MTMSPRRTRRVAVAVAAALGVLGLSAAEAAAVAPGANGRIACSWINTSSFNQIGLFDPVSGAVESVPDAGDHEIPHDVAPSWAPDGRRLAYVSEHGGLFVWDTRTSTRLKITDLPDTGEHDPAWSPNGDSIAYVRDSLSTDPVIWVMNADGGRQRQLGSGEHPAWSPDGRRIAFSRGGEIHTMAADGRDVRRVTFDADDDTRPSWSPGGRRLLWLSPSPGSGVDVWIGAASGGNVRRATFAGNVSEAVWSPDGTQIAFERPVFYGDLWILSVATGEERYTEQHCGGPDWARVNRLPSASFTYAPDPPLAGQTLQLRSTASDPDGPVSLAWDTDGDGFDDGSGPTASRALRAGERSVRIRLRVRDRDGAQAVSEQTVAVGNRRPAASFATSNAAPRVGQTAVFTSTSSDPDGPLAALAWDLDGDGAFDDGNGLTAARTFAFAAVHIVRLQVTDADGAVDVATLSIEVSPLATGSGGTVPPPVGVQPLPGPHAGPSPPVVVPPAAAPPTVVPQAAPARPRRFGVTVRSSVATRGTSVPVRISCPVSCRGSVRIQTRAGRTRGTLAFRLRAGTTTLRIPVSRALIRQARRGPVRLRVVATMVRGSTRTTARDTFTLRAR